MKGVRRRAAGGGQLISPMAVAGLLALTSGAAWAQDRAAREPAEPTVEACAECHQATVTRFAVTPHASLDAEGLGTQVDAPSSCAACHGDPGRSYTLEGHLSDFARAQGCQAVFAFTDSELPAVKAQRCLACHAAERPRFHSSRHALAGMDCTSCHDSHAQRSPGRWPLQRALTQYGSAIQPESRSGICAECHGDVLAEFDLNERHRLDEGIIDCTDCHDPHSPQARTDLGGFRQRQCQRCHADKVGPFVFEHGAVAVEGCTACHTPHGSPNRHLLHFQSVAELCFGCHAAVPGFHARFDLDTRCTNCHSSIHGSYLDSHFLK